MSDASGAPPVPDLQRSPDPVLQRRLEGAIRQLDVGRALLDRHLAVALVDATRVHRPRLAAVNGDEMLYAASLPKIAIPRSPRYRLYDPRYNGGLCVGKEYGRAPAWRRDPLHQLSHGATAFQTARFYYLLETGQSEPDLKYTAASLRAGEDA